MNAKSIRNLFITLLIFILPLFNISFATTKYVSYFPVFEPDYQDQTTINYYRTLLRNLVTYDNYIISSDGDSKYRLKGFWTFASSYRYLNVVAHFETNTTNDIGLIASRQEDKDTFQLYHFDINQPTYDYLLEHGNEVWDYYFVDNGVTTFSGPFPNPNWDNTIKISFNNFPSYSDVEKNEIVYILQLNDVSDLDLENVSQILKIDPSDGSITEFSGIIHSDNTKKYLIITNHPLNDTQYLESLALIVGRIIESWWGYEVYIIQPSSQNFAIYMSDSSDKDGKFLGGLFIRNPKGFVLFDATTKTQIDEDNPDLKVSPNDWVVNIIYKGEYYFTNQSSPQPSLTFSERDERPSTFLETKDLHFYILQHVLKSGDYNFLNIYDNYGGCTHESRIVDLFATYHCEPSRIYGNLCAEYWTSDSAKEKLIKKPVSGITFTATYYSYYTGWSYQCTTCSNQNTYLFFQGIFPANQVLVHSYDSDCPGSAVFLLSSHDIANGMFKNGDYLCLDNTTFCPLSLSWGGNGIITYIRGSNLIPIVFENDITKKVTDAIVVDKDDDNKIKKVKIVFKDDGTIDAKTDLETIDAESLLGFNIKGLSQYYDDLGNLHIVVSDGSKIKDITIQS